VPAPDFVVVGHAVQDLLAEGWRLGGTVTFAAEQAKRLRVRAGIVTRASSDLDLKRWLPRVAVAGRASECSTQFANVYERGRRHQTVPQQAPALAAVDVPAAWRDAAMVLLGPVCGELPAGFGALFPQSLVGVSAQGWLRRLDRERHVQRATWAGEPFWAGCDVLFVSDEDIGRRTAQVDRWREAVPVVAITRYRKGARIYEGARKRSIGAFPASEVDPTGAGDIFATAFLVRYHETGEVAEAARFASAAAACAVEGPGIEHIAGRREIEARMRMHPEIRLQ
jgi:hypothetical protein